MTIEPIVAQSVLLANENGSGDFRRRSRP